MELQVNIPITALKTAVGSLKVEAGIPLLSSVRLGGIGVDKFSAAVDRVNGRTHIGLEIFSSFAAVNWRLCNTCHDDPNLWLPFSHVHLVTYGGHQELDALPVELIHCAAMQEGYSISSGVHALQNVRHSSTVKVTIEGGVVTHDFFFTGVNWKS